MSGAASNVHGYMLLAHCTAKGNLVSFWQRAAVRVRGLTQGTRQWTNFLGCLENNSRQHDLRCSGTPARPQLNYFLATTFSGGASLQTQGGSTKKILPQRTTQKVSTLQ
jgi:hypothetical protein